MRHHVGGNHPISASSFDHLEPFWTSHLYSATTPGDVKKIRWLHQTSFPDIHLKCSLPLKWPCVLCCLEKKKLCQIASRTISSLLQKAIPQGHPRIPVHRKENSAGNWNDHTRDAPEEHDNFDEPGCLLLENVGSRWTPPEPNTQRWSQRGSAWFSYLYSLLVQPSH